MIKNMSFNIQKNLLIVILTLTISSLSLSDENNIECEQTFSIDEVFFNEDIVGYYIAAFDLSTGVSNVLMFDYAIQSNEQECYLPGELISLTIDFSIKIQIPDIGINSYTQLSSGKFKITNVLGPLHFRNTDLNLSNSSIGSANIEVLNFSIDENNINLEELSSSVLQTGKIPNGSYMFDFKLLDSQNNIIDTEIRTIDVYEPSFLELISPGGEVADTLETSIFSSYPVFSWNADFCSSCTYGIRIAEYNPSEHTNLADAINDISSFPLNQSDDFFNLPANINVFQYPVSNAADLEMGKLYAWQVRRTYETTVGNSDDFSPIYVFKILSPEDIAIEDNKDVDILELIKELLGESKYNQLFGPGGQLEGYFVYSMSLNGTEVTEEGLRPLAKDLGDGKRVIIETMIIDE